MFININNNNVIIIIESLNHWIELSLVFLFLITTEINILLTAPRSQESPTSGIIKSMS